MNWRRKFGSGLIGLLILFWGMQAAWKLMAAVKVVVDGPFETIRLTS